MKYINIINVIKCLSCIVLTEAFTSGRPGSSNEPLIEVGRATQTPRSPVRNLTIHGLDGEVLHRLENVYPWERLEWLMPELADWDYLMDKDGSIVDVEASVNTLRSDSLTKIQQPGLWFINVYHLQPLLQKRLLDPTEVDREITDVINQWQRINQDDEMGTIKPELFEFQSIFDPSFNEAEFKERFILFINDLFRKHQCVFKDLIEYREPYSWRNITDLFCRGLTSPILRNVTIIHPDGKVNLCQVEQDKPLCEEIQKKLGIENCYFRNPSGGVISRDSLFRRDLCFALDTSLSLVPLDADEIVNWFINLPVIQHLIAEANDQLQEAMVDYLNQFIDKALKGQESPSQDADCIDSAHRVLELQRFQNIFNTRVDKETSFTHRLAEWVKHSIRSNFPIIDSVGDYVHRRAEVTLSGMDLCKAIYGALVDSLWFGGS